MNEKTNARQGVGCDANGNGTGTATVDPEVMPPAFEPAPSVTVGPVAFDSNALFRSPCFWLLLGVGSGVALTLWLQSRDSR